MDVPLVDVRVEVIDDRLDIDVSSVGSAVGAPEGLALLQCLATVETAIAEFQAGRPIIMVDSADRENEGDICVPADACTPELINFMASEGRGLICVALTGDRLDTLRLPLMTDHNTASLGTAFTVSVDARAGATTGISAQDRARTVQLLVDPMTKPSDLVRPGHIFPLRARPGGVLERAGHTEASVDLARIAGRAPAAVICEVMSDDGTMARMPSLLRFAEAHKMQVVAIDDLIAYRLRTERVVQRVAEARMPTRYGDFTVLAYTATVGGQEHVALRMGNVASSNAVPVHVHRECVTGEAFGSLGCSCAAELDEAFRTIATHGCGVIIYLGSADRSRSVHSDSVHALDHLDLQLGWQMLIDLGVERVRLLTSDPGTADALAGSSLEVVDVLPLGIVPSFVRAGAR